MSWKSTNRIALAWVVALVGAHVSCGESPSEEIVAVVGEARITIGEVELFVSELSPALRSQESGDAARRDYVESLVSEHLLVTEARARGLDQQAEFLDDLERRFREKVVSNYHRDKLGPAIGVSEDEIQDHFVRHGYDRIAELGRIVVATLEEAEALHRELARGAPFDSLARVHSLDERTAPQGGLLGRLTWPEAERGGIPRYVFAALKPGEVSAPLELAEVFQLIRCSGEGEANISAFRAQLHREISREKFTLAHNALVESLTVASDLQVQPAGLGVLIGKSQGQSLNDDEAETPLYTYAGGRVTAGDYMRIFHQAKKPPALGDSVRVVRSARKLAANVLIWEAAKDGGYPTRDDLVLWRQRKERDLLIGALRRIEATEKIVVSDSAVEQYFEEHRSDFRQPRQMWVDEILLESREEAEDVRRRLQAGESFAELAPLTIRHGGVESEARLHLHSYETPAYGDLVPEAADAELNQLMGPLKVKGGYSVFRVNERGGGQSRSLEEASPRIRGMLNMIQREQLFDGLIDQLRERYAGEITISEAVLSRIQLPGES